jgi:hypothetical protein
MLGCPIHVFLNPGIQPSYSLSIITIVTFVIHGSTFKNFFQIPSNTPCKRTERPELRGRFTSTGLNRWRPLPGTFSNVALKNAWLIGRAKVRVQRRRNSRSAALNCASRTKVVDSTASLRWTATYRASCLVWLPVPAAPPSASWPLP